MFLNVHPDDADTCSLTNPEESEADTFTRLVSPISVVTTSVYLIVLPFHTVITCPDLAFEAEATV